MYTVTLTIHSIVRWLIVIAALLSLIRAANGLAFKRGWTQMDNRVGMWFTVLLDIQMLLGIVLYFFLSPTTLAALKNFGGAMGDTVSRFFAVEHFLIMVVAIIVAHVGRSLIRKVSAAPAKHRRTLIWFGLALLLILAAIPWPFLSYGRPLI